MRILKMNWANGSIIPYLNAEKHLLSHYLYTLRMLMAGLWEFFCNFAAVFSQTLRKRL